MLTIITGTPGAGKTLYTVFTVEKLRQEFEQKAKRGAGPVRDVYYAGVNGVTLPWIKIRDPKNWHLEVVDGSLVVFDEAWKYFPAVATGAARPPGVEAFAEHRHKGIDVWFTTQHGTQIDTFPRKMAGEHIHVTRAWGAKVAKLYKWKEFQADPNDFHAKKAALAEIFNYPKEAYNWYKSAEIHTKVQSLPWKKLVALPAAIIVVIGAIWVGLSSMPGREDEETTATNGSPISRSAPAARVLGADLWGAETWVPRVSSVPMSAPGYDAAIEVKGIPRVSGVISHLWSDGRFDCYGTTPRSVRIDLAQDVCLRYARLGIHDFTLTDDEFFQLREPERPQERRTNEPQREL